ncbi:hypothetical protein K2173_027010 [Erythroxylum novogranatense]|uniref:DUF4378 domain-containing protein n=1 Tax=Erythroxylum novogranatense TaxID=1862640 RepID=A0AAV8U0E0_9ROSI|nr:hypothetical protein K2173_027010 [Erythroxylum novogranatense]
MDYMMDGERKRSKGRPFHLFDWNGKSPKKLFSNNNGFPEVRQRIEIVESSSESPIYTMEVGNKGANSTRRGSSDFSCSLTVTSDEGYATRAPGVIARLMGLDSLPTSSVLEPSFTLFSDCHLPRTPQLNRASSNLSSDYDSMKNLNRHCEQERDCWKSVASMSHKAQSRPFERFQSEILPPKSPKPIPNTHNKLFSPVRSPGFNPVKNATCVMETAAKIIGASPKTATTSRVSLIGSPSVPLRDLKQKMEAAKKASRPQKVDPQSNTKSCRGQPIDKKQNGSENMPLSKASVFPEGNSSNLKNKGKSVSQVAQVKASIQRREGSTSTSDNFKKQKVPHDIKSNQLLKQQKNIQKRTSENMANNVLRQNSQKQNTLVNKDNSFSNRQKKKFQSVGGSTGPNRIVNKVVIKPENASRKNVSRDPDSEREKANIPSQKKHVNRDFETDRNLADKLSFDEVERPTEGNVTRDGNMAVAYNAKHGMDVVSFTFTSPIMKTISRLQSPVHVAAESNSTDTDAVGSSDPFCSQYLMYSMPQLNVMGSEASSVLLEEKPRELTNRTESFNFNIIREETYASSKPTSEILEPALDMVRIKHKKQDIMFHLVLDEDKSDHPRDFDCLPTMDQQPIMCQNWQLSQGVEIQSDETEEYSCSNYSETEKELECLEPCPVSTLELSFISECCTNAKGILFSLSPEAAEVLNETSVNESLALEDKIDFSNSASSICTVDEERKHSRTFSGPRSEYSNSLELTYVREVFNYAEPMLKDFLLSQSPKAMRPNLFDWMENQETQMQRNEEKLSKLGRKILFDCICDHLDFICGQVFGGSWKAWATIWTLLQRKGWLANQLYKEILRWKSMGDMMVDELVAKDMSTQYGRWLDFDLEALEEGIEIEEGILTSLVDELVFDLFS